MTNSFLKTFFSFLLTTSIFVSHKHNLRCRGKQRIESRFGIGLLLIPGMHGHWFELFTEHFISASCEARARSIKSAFISLHLLWLHSTPTVRSTSAASGHVWSCSWGFIYCQRWEERVVRATQDRDSSVHRAFIWFRAVTHLKYFTQDTQMAIASTTITRRWRNLRCCGTGKQSEM